ncbi:hypothetical protein E2C01_051890 [Portunus trituberculatus]|uniref:Uncharacterized protein n=1 Tax=Portunus trituberculatus TaxID=210409 RepID=A0A5B7GC76_PORTR|nr:hypothetical protein [Portunus trituberculatus]
MAEVVSCLSIMKGGDPHRVTSYKTVKNTSKVSPQLLQITEEKLKSYFSAVLPPGRNTRVTLII